jgi:prolyl oligopeptidase
MRIVVLSSAVFFITMFTFGQNVSNQPAPAPPKARAENVVDTIHGVQVADPYRWMENADSPETQQYVRDEMAYTRSVLNPLPGRDVISTRLKQLLEIGTLGTPKIGGEYYFYTRREGTKNQPVLYVRQGQNGKDRVLVDVNPLAADGTISLDWWFPSSDGKYLAYGTSPSGTEMSMLHIVETATGKLLPDTIERTRAASVAWKPDSTGFYYTRYPKKGEVPAGQEMYNRKVFYHALGTDPASDPLIFGEELEPEWWPNVEISEDGHWLLIDVSQGWAKSELWIKDLKTGTPAVPVAKDKNFLYSGVVYKDTIYLLTNEDASRYRIFAVPASNPARSNWKEIIPQSDAVITGVNVAGGKLLLQEEKNATSLLRLFGTDGKFISEIAMPAIGSVTGVGAKWDRQEAFYDFQSFTVPPTIYRIDLNTVGKRKQPSIAGSVWAHVEAPSIDPSKYEVRQVWYTSEDGTKVPMFVVARKGTALDGHNPTLLTGYGGFNVSLTPSFTRHAYLWLEHGGIFAVANLRGGAEFGEDWHRAGMLGNKQHVFDDFIAAGEYLIAQKYTDKDHLAIEGGSNGGLLVGAALTQRPDLFRAVVCQVPLLDMIRYQNFQIAKLWIPEYGSSDDPEQFQSLYAYSPYHHVRKGMVYPAVLFMTADSDSRVDPMHAKKMAALMQADAVNGSEHPILLRIESKAGHGAGKPLSKIIEENIDIYSFLFWQLGVKP